MKNFCLSFVLFLFGTIAYCQNKEIKFYMSSDSSKYIKFTYLNQVWLRANQNNPGTIINEEVTSDFIDLGLRRTRMQLFGNIHKNVFVYLQLGQNNFSFNSPRKTGFFIHDALNEFKIYKNNLSIGMGLTAWNGLSRYSSPSIGSILAMDTPLYQQTTADVNDQFVRKLSVYAKGKFGKFDYRLVLSRPMDIAKGSASGIGLDTSFSFSTAVNSIQNHGYLTYSFWEKESNLTPFMKGTYLGTKKVFNVGVGYLFQPNALWKTTTSDIDTVFSDMLSINGDIFLDYPLDSKKRNAITFYGAYTHRNFGDGYIRNVGPMNISNTVNNDGSLNGAGNAIPLIGTGNTIYFQIGYLFKRNFLSKKMGTLQPYFVYQENRFNGLAEPGRIYNVGINWLIDGHRSKFSLDLQNRPVYSIGSFTNRVVSERKNCVVLQYQIAI